MAQKDGRRREQGNKMKSERSERQMKRHTEINERDRDVTCANGSVHLPGQVRNASAAGHCREMEGVQPWLKKA
jgi:hypothetical protein